MGFQVGNCNINGNELADMQAKKAANITRICTKAISASDIKPHIKNQIFTSWKEEWENLQHNKLKNIGAKIGIKFFSNFDNRKEEIKFTRIRLGHSRLTHNFLLTGDEPNICVHCHVHFSILHIILVCPRFYEERKKFFGNSIISIKQILDRNNRNLNKSVLNFFSAINILSEI